MRRVTILLLSFLTACPKSSKPQPGHDAAAGPKSTSTAPASADASAPPPITAPPAQATIDAAGGAVGVAGAVLTLPPGAVTAPIEISISAEAADLDPLITATDPDYRATVAGQVTVLRTFRLGPDGTQFATPATLTIPVTPADLPAGVTMDQLAVVLVSNGEVTDLPARPVAGGLAVDVPHCSLASLVFLGMAGVATALAASYLRGATEPMMRRDCASWLDPTGRVKDIANDKDRFLIDTVGGGMKLYLDKPIVGKLVGQGNHLMRPQQLLDKPEGDCVNMSSLYGSMLVAKGYPVRLVAGNATYNRNGKRVSGLHQWAETVIDGKAYYVDTYDADKPQLIPLAEATTSLKLARTQSCGKDPDGTSYGAAKYDFRWYDKLKTGDDTDALVQKYKAMQEEHRTLAATCNAGDDAACAQRRELYEEAMKLRALLNARGVDPTK